MINYSKHDLNNENYLIVHFIHTSSKANSSRNSIDVLLLEIGVFSLVRSHLRLLIIARAYKRDKKKELMMNYSAGDASQEM